jgi:hypothetical protein
MNESESHEEKGALSWAKKLMTVGVGTFFLTEEALKTLVSEFKLPKEIVGSILDGAKGVRAEFMQKVVAEAMSKVSEKMDPAAIVSEILKRNDITFEVKLKVTEKSADKTLDKTSDKAPQKIG